MLASSEIYDRASETWSATSSLNVQRASHTATRLKDGRVLVAGGWNNTTEHVLASAELYDPKTGVWSQTASMHTPRYWHSAVLLANGDVMVTGGLNDASVVSGTEIYDPISGTWKQMADMPGGVISGYMGKSDTLDEALAAFSVAHADQNERDHAVLKRAIRKGKVKAVSERVK